HDADWRNYRPQVILDDIFQILTACNAHPVIVCGLSYGGLLAMALGALAPTFLAGVILNDVGPELDPEGSRRIVAYIARDRPQPDWPTAIAEMKRTMPALALGDEDAWRRFTEATYRPGADGQLHFDWDISLAKMLHRPESTPELWPLYRTLRNVPVLALRGGLSDVLSEPTFARMATVKPDLLQLTIPGVGHVPSFELPAVEHAIDDFLARIDA
ncbi:MAG TPA: alpha/beta hydrolase, partial [Kiloniellales bacterium]